MALKTSNKNRNYSFKTKIIEETVVDDSPWVPLKDLAKKETILDVMEVERKWTPLPKIHKET